KPDDADACGLITDRLQQIHAMYAQVREPERRENTPDGGGSDYNGWTTRLSRVSGCPPLSNLPARPAPRHRIDYVNLLRFRQLGIHRQRDRFARCSLGMRKIPAAMTKTGETLLHVQRHRVIHLGPHSLALQKLAQSIAMMLWHSNHILIEHMSQ